MRQVIDFFGGEIRCVYCGSQAVARWDHLIAVNRGGETVIGNMVPACSACDDSKQHHPIDEWLPTRLRKLGQPEDRVQERLAKLAQYVERFEYQVRPLEVRLTADEVEHLAGLRTDLTNLRKQLDDFFIKVQARAKASSREGTKV